MKDVVSGEWLYYDAGEESKRARVGFECNVTGHFSFGVTCEVTLQVLQAMVETVESDTDSLFEMRSNGVFFVPDDGSEPDRLGPKDNGLYDAPGWAWDTLPREECDRIVYAMSRQPRHLEVGGAWHGGPERPSITRQDDGQWMVWIPPIGPNCYERGDVAEGALIGPWGETFWPTQDAACEFLQDVVDTEPICGAGHPLIVGTKGTFWLTVDAKGVHRATVLADAGDAGNLDPNPFWVMSCSEWCKAPISDGARKRAIELADGFWPDLVFMDGEGYVRIEG